MRIVGRGPLPVAGFHPKIIIFSVYPVFSLLVPCGFSRRNSGRQVRKSSIEVATDPASVSTSPSIEFNGVAHTLLLSSLLIALLSHTMVNYPSIRQSDQPLIPTSLSLNSPNPQNQRSARILSHSSVASPVHRTSFPFTPTLLPGGPIHLLTPPTIFLQRQRCQEIPRETQTHRERDRCIL